MASQEFIQTVGQGDLDKARQMLAADPSLIDAKQPDGNSVIMWAAYCGQPAMIDLLVEHGAQLNLYEAAVTGRAERVGQLLDENPALLNEHSHDGWSPLHLAAFAGQNDVVRLLLERGADTQVRSKSPIAYGNTPLHAAIAFDRVEAARRLIAAGADVNARQEPGGFTPLHIAAFGPRDAIVALLLEHDAHVNARTDDGRTAFAIALEKGNTGVAELLRARGGEV